MAATVQIHEMSALAAGTDKTSGTVRFKAADNATVDANDPLVIPADGSIYSYTKKLRPYMEAPPDTNISNLRWYSDASSAWGAEIGVTCKNLGVTWGDNYNTQMSDGADFFGKTSGSPLDGDGADAGPFVPGDDNSYIVDLIELQMSVTSAATQGMLAARGLTLASLDALMQRRWSVQGSLDSLIRREGVAAASSLNGVIKRMDIAAASSLDAILRRVAFRSHWALRSNLFMGDTA